MKEMRAPMHDDEAQLVLDYLDKETSDGVEVYLSNGFLRSSKYITRDHTQDRYEVCHYIDDSFTHHTRESLLAALQGKKDLYDGDLDMEVSE